MISSLDICLLIESGLPVSISYDNCYSSTVYDKIYNFLHFVHWYERKENKKVFFKKETFRKNYFTVVNELYVNIDLTIYKTLD